jgi:hypothetical protein
MSFFRLLVICLGLSLGLSACSWLNSSPKKVQAEAQPNNPTDPTLPYFVINFSRTDGQPLEAFNVTQYSKDVPANTVWALDDHRLAITKLANGASVFFAIDFGPDFEIAQMDVSIDPNSNCTVGEAIYSVATFNYSPDSKCAPNPYMIQGLPTLGPGGVAVVGTF